MSRPPTGPVRVAPEDLASRLAAVASGLLSEPADVLVVEAGRRATGGDDRLMPDDVPAGHPELVVAVGRGSGTSAGMASSADVALTQWADPPAPWVQVDDVDEVLDRLAAVFSDPVRGPAARVLLQVLRLGRGRSPADGLVVESAAFSMLLGGPGFASWRSSRPVGAPRPGSGPPVLVDRDGDVLRVGLNRPEVHNAYNRAVRDGLWSALAVAAADRSCRVELYGTGPSFCSGGDLDEFGSAPDPVSAHAVRIGRSPARQLADLGPRVTALLHGSCAGSGIELPAFAGRVLARPGSRIWLPELAMGLIPGAGGTVSLPLRIGRQRTAWMALTGAVLEAERARQWGLVDEIVDP